MTVACLLTSLFALDTRKVRLHEVVTWLVVPTIWFKQQFLSALHLASVVPPTHCHTHTHTHTPAVCQAHDHVHRSIVFSPTYI